MKSVAVLEMPARPEAEVRKESKKRRAHGSGRVWNRGTEARPNWWIQYYARGRQIREAGGATQAVAEEQLRRRLVETSDGQIAPQRMSYEQLRDALYADYETHGNKSLFTHKDGSKYLGPVPALDDHFKGFKAERITPEAMKDFIRDRQRAGASNSNINHALRLLRRMFWLQVEESRLPSNLVPHFPMLKNDRSREDFLTPAEYQKVLAEFPANLKPLLICAYHTGARRGELLKLKWADVDLDGGLLTFRDTKNGTDRDVPVLEPMRAPLEKLRAANPEAEYVFVRGNGERIRDFKRAWKNATTRAGLAGRKFHGLRRGMAVNLMAAGMDSQTARKITGHRDAFTFERYRVLQRGAILEAGAKLAAHLKKGARKGPRR
jgi:integrase